MIFQFDNKGRNFLHTAIQKRDVESVLFLLSIAVDVNSRVQDPSQTTPLHLAALSGNAVSYTHLDVYKRQCLNCAFPIF